VQDSGEKRRMETDCGGTFRKTVISRTGVGGASGGVGALWPDGVLVAATECEDPERRCRRHFDGAKDRVFVAFFVRADLEMNLFTKFGSGIVGLTK